jgi:hypothetical protein
VSPTLTRRAALSALLASAVSGLLPGKLAAQALPPFTMTSLALYQPEEMLPIRFGGDVGPLADYVEALVAAADRTFAGAKRGTGVSGALVVALRPGRRSKVWLALGDNRLDDELRRALIAALEAVPPVEVHGGPFAFNLNFEAWGGGTPATSPESPLAIAPEWRGVKVSGVMPDAVLDVLWPDSR